jgi:hypothetical protein
MIGGLWTSLPSYTLENCLSMLQETRKWKTMCKIRSFSCKTSNATILLCHRQCINMKQNLSWKIPFCKACNFLWGILDWGKRRFDRVPDLPRRRSRTSRTDIRRHPRGRTENKTKLFWKKDLFSKKAML